ncbi:MAG: 2-thiouracil desulfurase family protein [Deltaproteobacteria bacterium]|nr:2-thiouracil desulfurase family protein [Deltaproteobacteria bacterium]
MHRPTAADIDAWPRPTPAAPLAILMSGCLAGNPCGVDGTDYGGWDREGEPFRARLLASPNVRITPFCPEDAIWGTPRALCDIHGGNGFDVVDGKARVLTEAGEDWTAGMLAAGKRMVAMAKIANVRVAILMDVSAACGSQVVYLGRRTQPNKVYQRGPGVCAAMLMRAGVKVVAQRDAKTMGLLLKKIDPTFVPASDARDWDECDWYREYFNTKPAVVPVVPVVDAEEARKQAVQREVDAAFARAVTIADQQRTEADRVRADADARKQKSALVQNEMEAAWARAAAKSEQKRVDADSARTNAQVEAQARARADAEAKARSESSKQQDRARAQAEMEAAWQRASSSKTQQRAEGEQSRESAQRKQALAAQMRREMEARAQDEARETEARAKQLAAYEELMATAGIRPHPKRTLLAKTPWQGRFDVVGILGRGAQGVTFAVTDRQNHGAPCAAKVFDMVAARDWNDLIFAEREADALKRVKHALLPEYVTVLVDADSGDRIVITKRINGMSLTDATAHFPVAAKSSSSYAILSDLFDALDALHNATPPLVHRDVKPDNVIVAGGASGLDAASFHLIDLGGVGLLNHKGTGTIGVGTLGFIAPEQLYGEYGASSDLFSLAMSVVSFVSNIDPPELPKKGLAVDVEASVPMLGKSLRKFLASLLRPEAAQRPPTVAAAREELAKVAQAEGVDLKRLLQRRSRGR